MTHSHPSAAPPLTAVSEDTPTPFDALPASARLWIFGVSRRLEPNEEALLLNRVDAFIAEWAAHGHPLAAARQWREDRFLLVAVDDRVTPPSGCSTDSLIRALRRLEVELDLEMVGNAPVWYRSDAGEVVRVSRPVFKRLASRGEVGHQTQVFDLSLTRVEELRAGNFEGPAGERWHARLLPER